VVFSFFVVGCFVAQSMLFNIFSPRSVSSWIIAHSFTRIRITHIRLSSHTPHTHNIDTRTLHATPRHEHIAHLMAFLFPPPVSLPYLLIYFDLVFEPFIRSFALRSLLICCFIIGSCISMHIRTVFSNIERWSSFVVFFF